MLKRLLASGTSALALAATAAANPLFAGADPEIAIAEGRFWIYSTSPGTGVDELFAWQSCDLRAWTRTGPLLAIDRISWLGPSAAPARDLWAPSLVRSAEGYHLYYSVGPQTNGHPSQIGIATAASPAGPFTDTGAPVPIPPTADPFEAIDPMVFIDPRSGGNYLYAGGSDGSRLRVFRLKSNIVEIEREETVAQPPMFTEGPFMHVHGGRYYLSYSSGSWRDSSYSVHYAIAPAPLGPWTYKGRLFAPHDRHKGPGHHAFLRHPATGRWYVVYHRWNDAQGAGPYVGDRQIAIERIRYLADGSIAPVRMTDVKPRPSRLSGRCG